MEMEGITVRPENFKGQQLEDLEMGWKDGECGATYKNIKDKEKKLEIITVQDMGNTSVERSTSPRVVGENTRREKGMSTRTTRGNFDATNGTGSSVNDRRTTSEAELDKDVIGKTATGYSSMYSSNV